MRPNRKPKPARPNYGPGYVPPSRQRVDINISHGRPNAGEGEPTDPAKQGRINSNLKRMVAMRQKDPRIMFTSQSPSDFYGIGRDDISQIVATREKAHTPEQMRRLQFAASRLSDNPEQYVHDRTEGRVVGGELRPGVPNRTIRADHIVADIIRKYDEGQQRMTIDELAAGTAPEVNNALHQLAASRPDVLKGMSLYLASGPGTGPKKFDPKLIRLLSKHRIPVYAQLYGGRVDAGNKPWNDRKWRGAVTKFNQFRDAGLNVKPLMSFSDKHIGQGPNAVNEARTRAWRIFRETGYIPSVWHATSVRAPAPEGLGAAAERWIQRMRRQK